MASNWWNLASRFCRWPHAK